MSAAAGMKSSDSYDQYRTELQCQHKRYRNVTPKQGENSRLVTHNTHKKTQLSATNSGLMHPYLTFKSTNNEGPTPYGTTPHQPKRTCKTAKLATYHTLLNTAYTNTHICCLLKSLCPKWRLTAQSYR